MDKLIPLYQALLNLQNALFLRIDHAHATVAIVYKVTLPTTKAILILKVCPRTKDYLNEVYFLTYFANLLPVPGIIQRVSPQADLPGAILMEYLPGILLSIADFTTELAYEIGSLLARIHLNKAAGYGDLIQTQELSANPQNPFRMKFEEGLAECSNHLPPALIQKCRDYLNVHINLLESADGPCITHRDFRAGNIIVDHGKVQGIIDWSAARGGFAQEDFCHLEHDGWQLNVHTKKSFLAGYASIRPIPNYNVMMPLLRLSRAVAIVGFTVKRGTWQNKDAELYHYNRTFLENL